VNAHPHRLSAILPPDDEARLVEEFFGPRTGFFVEVGANDPREGSQSWHLEQRGWSGILVEPQPDLAVALRRNRKAKVYQAACSSPEHAGRPTLLHIAGPFSSLDPKLAVTGIRAQRQIEVAVRTLDDILTEAGAPAPLDFLSVDVEGHEIDVLRGFDFARWRPRLILLEDHITNLSKHRFLQRAGYYLIRRTGLNAWYVPADLAPPLDAFGRWQVVRKYYLSLPFRMLREGKRRLRDRLRLAVRRRIGD
jgi:FkbM family methyltransferase